MSQTWIHTSLFLVEDSGPARLVGDCRHVGIAPTVGAKCRHVGRVPTDLQCYFHRLTFTRL